MKWNFEIAKGGMGGTNPYIQKIKAEAAKKPFKITFQLGDESKAFEADPAKFPYQPNGLPGSILDIALGNGIELDHACGGVCACSTCHIIVEQGLKTCNEASEDEEDELEQAPGITPNSRLACQCIPNGQSDLLVKVPSWNRNLVKEDHH